MKFFVPKASPDEAEAFYGRFAAFASRAPAPPDARVYSITFRHDSEIWTATVGERLRGVREHRQRRRYAAPRVDRPSDPAIVLAIFAGVPYTVVTDGRPLGGARSAWVNPFMAGQPQSVELFEAPEL